MYLKIREQMVPQLKTAVKSN